MLGCESRYALQIGGSPVGELLRSTAKRPKVLDSIKLHWLLFPDDGDTAPTTMTQLTPREPTTTDTAKQPVFGGPQLAWLRVQSFVAKRLREQSPIGDTR